MNEDILFPSYVPRREEEREIREEIARVRADRKSRAVLLYGPGGIGKTSLVRALPQSEEAGRTAWLAPVDVDDPEYWLLSYLEQSVVEQLDQEHHYFGPYLEYLSRLPSYSRPRIGRETIVSHLGRIKRVFVDCYTKFIEDSGKTVVMAFDTVEMIRGFSLLYTLTHWMKALPGTLFILSGRPLRGAGHTLDPIKSELEDPHNRIPVTEVRLGEFTREDATAYLKSSAVSEGLTDEEIEALVLLTQGHPLWLAFAISYVSERSLPEEAETPLATISRDVPYGEDPSEEGRSLQEAFRRRLVTPYREVDFWHEAVKRLAVVRHAVNQPIWQELMSDRWPPEDVSNPDEAWEELKRTPWIRTRANGRYVALHDAVAEELARRIIPLHDRDQKWRRDLWARAAAIYAALVHDAEAELAPDLEVVNTWLQQLAASGGEPLRTEEEAAQESASIKEVARLDARKRELDQFRAVGLYYQLLSDYPGGSQRFLDLFEDALSQNDVFLQDRLALEMQRFLPGAVNLYVLDDIVGGAISKFQAWLSAGGRKPYLKIGISLAGYLIENEQAEVAIELLDRLPERVADHAQLSRLRILKSNAYIRIPGHAADGLPQLRKALRGATVLKSADRQILIADAYKELGFYYRNRGLWRDADEAYGKARAAIFAGLSGRGSDEDHENIASIQTNWAYVKGLNGEYRDGSSLVESAIIVRRRLNLHLQVGISLSVCGEVYRYERRFAKAWESFAEAEQIFQGQRNWSWLGMIYQEQAICLFQALEDGTNLVPDRDPMEHCKQLIILALDICHDQNLRGYPSALNRAGRIYGKENFDAGLGYLKEGIDSARMLSDGWFWFANLIEYAELSYRAWDKTSELRYRDEIASCAEGVAHASEEYQFGHLEGRWKLIQGHLAIHDALDHDDSSRLGAALDNYRTGFSLLGQTYVGSSGVGAIGREFETFGTLFSRLPADVRTQWLEELRSAWVDAGQGSTPLLARLEQLYLLPTPDLCPERRGNGITSESAPGCGTVEP